VIVMVTDILLVKNERRKAFEPESINWNSHLNDNIDYTWPLRPLCGPFNLSGICPVFVRCVSAIIVGTSRYRVRIVSAIIVGEKN